MPDSNRNRGFPNSVFRQRQYANISRLLPTAVTGNVVSWCPHQLGEEVMV